MSDTEKYADKEDHTHDWVPPHMRQDTPVFRDARKAAAKTDAAKEAPAALDDAVRESKRDVPKAKQGRKR
jgi:hypothetical protein